MKQFNRINIIEQSHKDNVSYLSYDVLRQTSIQQLCKYRTCTSADSLKKEILDNCKYLLDLMITDID